MRRRPGFWLLLGLILAAVLVAVARVVADPLAAHTLRKTLHGMEGYDGAFNTVHVGFLDLSFTITDLKLVERASSQREPLFYAKRISSKVLWKDLVRFRLTATTRIEHSKSVLLTGTRTAEKAKEAGKAVERAAKRGPAGLDVVDEQLKKLIPMRIARIEVLDSELVFVDRMVEPNARMWIRDVEATVENVATRERLTGGQSAIFALHGIMQKSGDLTLFISADPLAEKINLAGRMELRHLQLADMHSFFAGYSGLSVPRGTFDLLVQFLVKDDRVSGGVKPLLKDVDITSADANLGHIIEEKLASLSYGVFSRKDDKGEREVATTAPIDGTITGPHTQVYTAVLGILRNAFVVGLSEGFANLPPPVAGKSEGPLERAAEALSRKGEVRTQPDRGGHK